MSFSRKSQQVIKLETLLVDTPFWLQSDMKERFNRKISECISLISSKIFLSIPSIQKHLRICKWIFTSLWHHGMNYRWISSALREDVNLINLPTICDIDWANHYFKLITKTLTSGAGRWKKRKSFICKLLDGYWMLELLVFFFLGSSHKFLNYNNDYNQAFERMENQSSRSVNQTHEHS